MCVFISRSFSYRRRSEPLERELPELRDPDDCDPDDDELREGADGLETLGLLDELLEDRADGVELRPLSDEDEDTPLRLDSDDRVTALLMISHADELRVDEPVRPEETALSLEEPDRGLVKSMEGVLDVVDVRPAVERSPTDGVRVPDVGTTPDRVVPELRAPS